ncbi:MAG: hypothetical protein Fur0023_16390 [Bacteroidia bacterium]
MYKKLFIALVSITMFLYCSDNKKSSSENKSEVKQQNDDKLKYQLNITILLDLSDRIIKPMQPSPIDRDINIVKIFIDIFKNKMQNDGAFKAKSKIRVLFTPAPSDQNINNLAEKLSVDLSKMDTKKKKEVYDNIEKMFIENLSEIYDITTKTEKFIGSDIWRFFKYDVTELCIDKDNSYRNILVILTDGYIYHKQSVFREKNRTSYLTPVFIQKEGLRTPNWKSKFDSGDYGFISNNQSLENLEVMVLEINPNTPIDEDIIRAYLNKWFDEMKIKNKVFYNTDLTLNTKKRIEKFFNL